MAPSRAPSASLLRSLRALTTGELPRKTTSRTFTSSGPNLEEVQAESSSTSYYRNPDPSTVFVPRLERRLSRAGTPPIGSRRRRVALSQSPGIPFEQLPYQCFQEARKILVADREEKLKQIETERARIARLKATTVGDAGEEAYKQKRLKSMGITLEKLKILADINDPMIKKRFEDKLGDMDKPIYRYLAERKWREYRRKILIQRITQMDVVPDVIPHLDCVVDVKLAFGGKRIQPGDFVDSKISESPCRLSVQAFDRGEKLVTVAVVDADVPNLKNDSFDYRCHYLAANIPISPTSISIDLAKLSTESQILLPWLPAYAQKGSPYHRLAIIVLQQKDNIPLDLAVAMKKVQREGFTVRSFISRHMLAPIGATLFRTKWDENMAGVMTRAGIDGANVELKRKKVEPLPYKRRNPSSFR